MTVGITELPPEGMQLGGVALAGDPDRGTKTTEGLSLLFTTAGITVQGPQPQIERLLVWSGLDTATCREKIALTDGRSAAVMELTSGGQSIRFLLPTETVTPGQAAYLDQALPAWLTRYKGTLAPNGTGAVPPASAASGTDPGAFQPAAAAAGATVGTAASAAAAPPAPSPPAGAPQAPMAPAPPAPPAPAPPGAPAPSFTATPATAPPPPPPTAAPAPNEWAPAAAAGAGAAWGSAPAPDLSAPGAPAPDASGWDNPPLGQVPAGDVLPPVKKSRGWRKAHANGDTLSPGTGVSGDQTGDPTGLDLGTLPPPPASYGAPNAGGAAETWSPTADPSTGPSPWENPTEANGLTTPEAAPKKSRGWRKGSKAATAATAGAVAGAASGVTDAPGLEASPPSDPFGDAVPPTDPGDGSTLSPATTTPPPKNKRSTMVLVILLVVVVVAGGAFYYFKKHNNSTPPVTAPAVVAPPTAAADIALAGSINLRLTDLPVGWTRSPTTVQGAIPPVAPAASQVQAERIFAACVAQPLAVVAGLFGTAPLPGQTTTVKSPTYQSGTDANFQMYSNTTVMGTAAEAAPLAAPFANPNFVTCFTQYQSALIASSVSGASAQVAVVHLAAPAGAKTFGYITTFTIPNQGTEVVGEAFILGGRTQTRLEPTTNGPPVATSAFAPAYAAVVGRVAQAANR